MISVRTCGGGGYGPPAERDPERVLRDVLEGKVSAERARAIYQVAIDGRRLDEAATALPAGMRRPVQPRGPQPGSDSESDTVPDSSQARGQTRV